MTKPRRLLRRPTAFVEAGICLAGIAAMFPAVAEARGGNNASIEGGLASEQPAFPITDILNLVSVPYVTNRVVDAAASSTGARRGGDRGFEGVFKNVAATSLSYGVAQISSPAGRKPGEARYADRTKLENPFYDIAFWYYLPYPTGTALKAATDKLFPSVRDRRVLLYVHGMDNSFSDAVERLAQLKLDLGDDLVPLAFSWPSDIARSRPDRPMLVPWPGDYGRTRSVAERSAPDLVRTFDVARSLDGDVRVLAHSMGALVLDQAVAGIGARPGEGDAPRFPAVALAAPDVGSDAFASTGLRAMLGLTPRLTMYCSDDRALLASARVNGEARLGRCPDGAPPLPGAQAVKVVGRIADFSRHSYFLNSGRVIEHLRTRLLSAPAPVPAGSGQIDNRTVIDVDK